MKQLGLGLNLSTKRTRKREFLEEMERVVPWEALVQLVRPHAPKAKTGRPAFDIETMLRVHYMQQWFGLSDPAMEEALHDVPMYREFARLDGAMARLPDETTILRFRHLLEEHKLAANMLEVVNNILQVKGLMMRTGTVVDATLIAAPSSTKNAEGERDPEMKQTKKGNQWYHGMKAHIGVDADSGLVHTVTTTSANEADVEQVADLLHGKEQQVWADSGYRGAQGRVQREVRWHIAARPSDIAKLPEGRAKAKAQKIEHAKASVRAKVEHPFRVIKRQFGLVKVRFKGLQKNTAHVLTLFALSNLWMARRHLMGQVRPNAA
jgi:IS5 family transposase